jgi:hypothetical protein
VALDTARGQTYDITRVLYGAGQEGLELRAVAHDTGRTDDKTRTIMRFLRRIKAAETFQTQGREGIRSTVRWRLTPRLTRLYAEVIGDAESARTER